MLNTSTGVKSVFALNDWLAPDALVTLSASSVEQVRWNEGRKCGFIPFTFENCENAKEETNMLIHAFYFTIYTFPPYPISICRYSTTTQSLSPPSCHAPTASRTMDTMPGSGDSGVSPRGAGEIAWHDLTPLDK